MFKKIVSAAILVVGLTVSGHCVGAIVQDQGATSSGTVITVLVSSNPAPIFSQGISTKTAWGFSNFFGRQKMDDAVIQIIKNGSAEPIYLGFDATVSSTIGTPKFGLILVPTATFTIQGDVELWAVSNSSTGFNITGLQAK